MKRLKIIVLFCCMLSVFSLSGCGDRELSSAMVKRDDARTGGSLSFVYNKDLREIYVGGVDEVVQFSSANEALGLDEGTRIGLKFIAPDEQLDFSGAKLKMNGISYTDFLEEIEGQQQRFFTIYPYVSDVDSEILVEIKWQDGTKEQKNRI